ncbi:restriction endonuclease subunit S [Faecalibaculum rodentium]|uniref:restriction endonuclease subunit S n=1 Tax=Faecalibaculum rodentium TaxID=1702221 RepID=UPI0023F0B0AE|nr:restriction endonuclease subunit S [Faecalibaculum rodentium]
MADNVPKIRFPGFTEPWEQRKLGDIAQRILRKNKSCECTLPLTISAQYGLVDQEAFFNKRIASKDLSNYIVVKAGEFAYNKSYSEGYPWGAIKRLDRYPSGVVSSLYIVFSIRKERINSDFLQILFESDVWHKEVNKVAAEGARNHGLLNITSDDFFGIQLYLPVSQEEQFRIGSFFSELNNLITLHQRKLNDLKKLKSGLLQKMFPKNGETVPEVRFPGFTGDWEQRKLGDFSETFSGGTPSVGQKEYYGGSIPFIRSAEIDSNTTELTLTEAGMQNSSAKLVLPGDILYALYGATSGDVAISRIEGAINQAILAIKPSKEVDVVFLTEWLRGHKQEIIGTYLQGGQGNLSAAIIKKLIIEMPSLLEQQVIGKLFNQINNLITLHQRKLDDLKKLKQGLLQQMFV